jgi:hypothetical protein
MLIPKSAWFLLPISISAAAQFWLPISKSTATQFFAANF